MLEELRHHGVNAFVETTVNFEEKTPCIYIMASRRNGTLYTGVTSELAVRVGSHKQDLIEELFR